MTIERHEPEFVLDERPMLEGWLEYHRATLLIKCEGLTETQLKERSVPPSSLSLLGLVRHMTEVERGWFRSRLNDEPAPYIYVSDDDPDGDFNNLDSASADDVFRAWRQECDHSRTLAAQESSLDALARGARDETGSWQLS